MSSPDPPRAARLPAAEGVIGHLRHTWAVVRQLRSWRRQYQALDDQLREAVQVRDLRLVELGEAAYSARAQLSGEVADFANTLDDLAAEQSKAEGGVQNAGIELAAAEADRTEVLAKREAELRAARAAVIEPQRRLGEMDARLDAIDRGMAARKGERAAARAQIERLDPDTAADEEERAQRASDRAELEEQITKWDDEDVAQTAERRDLAGPRAALHETVERLSEAFGAAKDAYREARQAHDTRVDAAKASVAAAENQLETITGRRRAVATDLARAILQQTDLSLPGRPEAEAAVERIEAIRAERTTLDVEWEAFDGSAARRTGLCIAGLLVALIVLWIVL